MSWTELLKSALEGKNIPVSKELVKRLNVDVLKMFQWCNEPHALESVCSKYFELINSLLKTICDDRISWSDLTGSIDEKLLARINNILKNYYRYLIVSLHDEEFHVYVEVLHTFEIGDKRYPKGFNCYIPVEDAILLESLGLVKVITVPLVTEKITF
mgnify:CR=1 FL=1